MGTHSTSPLSRIGDLLDRREGTLASPQDYKPVVVLVADEDLNDYSDSEDSTRAYIHRGAPIEELVEALVRVGRA
jgi:hypothetical protein